MGEWYYQIMGEVIGPVSAMELKERAASGQIEQGTLVRKGESGDWVAAGRVKGLFDRPTEKQHSVKPPTPPPMPIQAETPPPVGVSVPPPSSEDRDRNLTLWAAVGCTLCFLLGIGITFWLTFLQPNRESTAEDKMLEDFRGYCQEFALLTEDLCVYEKTPAFDVEKTSSLVSPYIATVTFSIWQHITSEGIACAALSEYEVRYARQDGEWVCSHIRSHPVDVEVLVDKGKETLGDPTLLSNLMKKAVNRGGMDTVIGQQEIRQTDDSFIRLLSSTSVEQLQEMESEFDNMRKAARLLRDLLKIVRSRQQAKDRS